ncbi:MAG TPA: cytochrome c, partial [Xanthomonadales bacterium]|nr:cytochrome c [Xanthomonadales bacterium]
SGAGNYSAMCAACHLSPDAQETELAIGLYPRPPRWDTLAGIDPREAFWVVKHGIKSSGMPAWGKSMDDEYLWGLVAFMGQFGSMTAAQYSALVAASPGHRHGGGETDMGAGESRDSPARSAPLDGDQPPTPESRESGHDHEHGEEPHRH